MAVVQHKIFERILKEGEEVLWSTYAKKPFSKSLMKILDFAIFGLFILSLIIINHLGIKSIYTIPIIILSLFLFCVLSISLYKRNSLFQIVFVLTNKRGIVIKAYKKPRKNKQGKFITSTTVSLNYEFMESYSLVKLKKSTLIVFTKSKLKRQRGFVVDNSEVETVKRIIDLKGQINSSPDPSPQTPTQTTN